MGISLFSVMVGQWGRKEMLELELTRAERAKSEAEDIAKALEFSILTETSASYSEELSLERALAHTARSSAKTRGKRDFLLTERTDGSAFDLGQKRLAITASDDILLRAEVNRAHDSDSLARMQFGKKEAVVLLDTKGIRLRQVERSRLNMNIMAEHVYQFYAGHLRFPTIDEYESLQEKLGVNDVWGSDFLYTPIDEESGTIQFTTPWGYTQSLDLSLK